MKIVVPDYYGVFKCSMGACRHTCCADWEVDIDEESVTRFQNYPDITKHIEMGETPHFRLLDGERCPFLNQNGLCNMILAHGEDILCQTCRDHPRFRNFWSDRTEIGLGLVCEEACRLILTQNEPMKLLTLSDDGKDDDLPEDEAWLMDIRDSLWENISVTGMEARLREYLIYRHLPDALYDGLLKERIAFINDASQEITALWSKTDGSIDAIVEVTRAWSYDVEYDDEVLEKKIKG